MTGRSSLCPSMEMARSLYSPPCTPSGMMKSLWATPLSWRTRLRSTTAPLGLTSWYRMPWLSRLPAMVSARRSQVRIQMVSPGLYRGLSTWM